MGSKFALDGVSVSPLARDVFNHMKRTGKVTALDALRGLGITSGSLTRRITELQDAGVKISKTSKRDPITGRRYTSYEVAHG